MFRFEDDSGSDEQEAGPTKPGDPQWGSLRRALVMGMFFGLFGGALVSSIAYAEPPGKIEFVGRNLFAKANGTFHIWRIVEQTIDPEALEKSSAVVEIDLASIDTGIEGRDDHLRNPDFFEVERYPTARVRFHSAVRTGETEAGLPRYRAQFDIDLHGVQKTLEGEVIQASATPTVFEGALVVDRTDFGVGGPPSRWNPAAVKAEIPVRFRVELE